MRRREHQRRVPGGSPTSGSRAVNRDSGRRVGWRSVPTPVPARQRVPVDRRPERRRRGAAERARFLHKPGGSARPTYRWKPPRPGPYAKRLRPGRQRAGDSWRGPRLRLPVPWKSTARRRPDGPLRAQSMRIPTPARPTAHREGCGAGHCYRAGAQHDRKRKLERPIHSTAPITRTAHTTQRYGRHRYPGSGG